MTRWLASLSRRDIVRGVGSGIFGGIAARLPARAAQARASASLYEGIGVIPIINCRGTFTIISGSQSLPEVKQAMDEASRHYVHLDELMEGVGRRLAQLTQAEWGIVTAGCAAALTHATAACIAGSDPEKMQRIPDLAGLKNEVVMPRESRNVYDHAIRMLGVNIVTSQTREEYLAALRPSTAMVGLLGEGLAQHPMSLEEMVTAAHAKKIPVLVDAAAERLTIPNVYLAKGVDMVGYSGGKCLRGPQCAGLLLGPEGSATGRLDQQRSAPCLWPLHESWERRDHGHAGRGRGLDPPRSPGRVEAVGGLAGHHSKNRQFGAHGAR